MQCSDLEQTDAIIVRNIYCMQIILLCWKNFAILLFSINSIKKKKKTGYCMKLMQPSQREAGSQDSGGLNRKQSSLIIQNS